jgi:hypothetical protein
MVISHFGMLYQEKSGNPATGFKFVRQILVSGPIHPKKVKVQNASKNYYA